MFSPLSYFQRERIHNQRQDAKNATFGELSGVLRVDIGNEANKDHLKTKSHISRISVRLELRGSWCVALGEVCVEVVLVLRIGWCSTQVTCG